MMDNDVNFEIKIRCYYLREVTGMHKINRHRKDCRTQKEKPWKGHILQENYLYKRGISLQTQFILLKKMLYSMTKVTVELLWKYWSKTC